MKVIFNKMCTLIIDWHPNVNKFITIAANRDEDFNRPSEPFKERANGGFYPLDVKGGTWVGVNDYGIFAAITNRDTIYDHKKGMISRGKVIVDILKSYSIKKAMTEIAVINYKNYNPFNIIIADRYNLISIINDYDKLIIQYPDPGLHVITTYGIDTWDVPRCKYIKNNFYTKNLKEILNYKGNGKVNESVFVVDPKEKHKTISSCIIETSNDEFKIHHKYKDSSWKLDNFKFWE